MRGRSLHPAVFNPPVFERSSGKRGVGGGGSVCVCGGLIEGANGLPGTGIQSPGIPLTAVSLGTLIYCTKALLMQCLISFLV